MLDDSKDDWITFLSRSKYVDGKDEINDWLVAVVDKFNKDELIFEVHFDGWGKKYARVIMLISIDNFFQKFSGSSLKNVHTRIYRRSEKESAI